MCQKDSLNKAGTWNELSRFVDRCIIFEVTGDLEKCTLAPKVKNCANLFLKRRYQVFCILQISKQAELHPIPPTQLLLQIHYNHKNILPFDKFTTHATHICKQPSRVYTNVLKNPHHFIVISEIIKMRVLPR